MMGAAVGNGAVAFAVRTSVPLKETEPDWIAVRTLWRILTASMVSANRMARSRAPGRWDLRERDESLCRMY